MASKVKLKADTAKTAPYKVQGKTLAEIWADIQKKGPKDGGKSRAGFTTAPVNTPNSYKFDEEETDPAGKKGEVTWKVTAKSGELKMSPSIQMPELASDKDLSDPAKKEWARFLKELRAHEDEHVDATKTEAEAVATEIGEIEGIGSGKDQKAAVKKAIEDWTKQFRAKFDGGKLDKRLKKVNQDLDSGGHGPVLDTSIQ